MLINLDAKLETLIAEGKIKVRWSEIEDYGIAELVHVIFDYDPAMDNLAVTAEIYNRTVCLNLYEGIRYEHEGEVYTLARAYIDIDSNIIFATPEGELFMYETNILDAEDPKHYFANE
ncbi:MAG TPA: hypothetical protein VEG39_19750 [Clostridia bacterium]|nr:hypothetical protein [Clostridia bacterium]